MQTLVTIICAAVTEQLCAALVERFIVRDRHKVSVSHVEALNLCK
jgi:hypothetical protein